MKAKSVSQIIVLPKHQQKKQQQKHKNCLEVDEVFYFLLLFYFLY